MLAKNRFPRAPRNEMLPIIAAGGIVLAISFGVRAVFGGVVEPLSDELFEGQIDIFSLSIAIQNLVWGLAQPAFGMLADRYGDKKALWLGFSFYLLGMAICIASTTPLALHMGAGVLVGMGIAGTAFGTVLAVVGRAAPEEKRAYYLGITSAIGSTGQVLLPLLVSGLIEWLDWRATLAVVAVLLVPMALCIPLLRSKTPPIQAVQQSGSIPFSVMMRTAFGSSSYLMLGAGFFVCGFHLAFITAHFPNFVQHFCISPASEDELRALGLQALALVGFANIIGTLMASRLGEIFRKPHVLSAIYALRALVIVVFISFPVTPISVLVFSFVMGILWLSTVPLTSALVAVMFGPRAMGTLFGFIFLAHQLGSFMGVWLGGVFFDRTGDYNDMWYIAILLGVISALVHLLVEERPVPMSGAETAPALQR